MTKILIVDDEPSIRKIIKLHLQSKDYEVEVAENALKGLEKVNSFHPNLIILDLEMPDHSGLEFLNSIRKWSKVPVIVLTANDAEATKVTLLEAGADGYITKPFSMQELLARIKVSLRHHQSDEAVPVFESKDLKVDLYLRQVLKNGNVIKLTVTEYEVLRILIKHAGKVVTQTQILAEVWGKTATHNSHYLRIYIGQLRKKIEEDPSHPQHLLTEPGVGYRII